MMPIVHAKLCIMSDTMRDFLQATSQQASCSMMAIVAAE
jgi:hypothetical protein